MKYLFVIIIWLTSCNQNTKIKIEEKEIINVNIEDDENPNKGITFENLLKEYNSNLDNHKLDTIKLKDGFLVIHQYVALKDTAYIYPKNSIWDDNYKDLSIAIRDFEHIIKLKRNDVLLFNKSITKELFTDILKSDSNLLKKSIMLHPYFREYDSTNSSVNFGYSFTIPFSDVGIGVGVSIDLKGNIKVSG